MVNLHVQLKNHTVEVLKENDVNVILDMTYANDTLDLISEHIEVRTYICLVNLHTKAFTLYGTKFWQEKPW